MLKLATINRPSAPSALIREVDDAAFIAALDLSDFRDAPTIARFMLAVGTPAKLAMISARMAEFVAIGGVEADGDSWRIEPTIAPLPQIAPIIVGDATMYQADCLEGLRALPDASVDLVVTSPPYNLRATATCRKKPGKWKSKLIAEGYEAHDDAMDDAAYVEWQKEVLRECWRVLTDKGAIYYNHKARVIGGELVEPSRLNPGLPLRQIVTWDRGSGMNFSTTYYLPTCEQILIFAKPNFRLRDRKASGAKDVWRIAPERPSNKHPAPFPVELARMAIETTNAQVILDPFIGSGSTAVAALQLGRRVIGIENGPHTFATMVERLEEMIEITNDDEVPPAPTRANDNRPGLALNTIHHGDGLELMRDIPDASINLILCDPPYGTCGAKSAAGHEIDVPLDLGRLWAEYRRIMKPTGNIVVFASQPFTFAMYNAAPDLYKYSNIWRKDHATGHCHARNRPLKDFEEIMVFSPGEIGHAIQTDRRATFNPWKARKVIKKNNPRRSRWAKYAPGMKAYPGRHDYPGLENCPRMVLEYSKVRTGRHQFQKPVPLLDDLIRMYSNPGEVVLDNCAGSGSTAVAAIHAGRQFIAMEKAEDVYESAREWIAETLTTL